MKLKTLKDLELMKGWQFTTKDNEMYIKKGLRAEAIKWVKQLRKSKGDELSVIMWITHFFNITKEDLISSKPFKSNEKKDTGADYIFVRTDTRV